MVNPLKVLENLFYRARGILWRYPDFMWVREDSLLKLLQRIHQFFIPYSNFLISFLLVVGVGVFIANTDSVNVFASDQQVFIEGVVVGATSDGRLQTLSKINPLYPTLVQLERDINELVYEPLIIYEQDERVTPVLADGIVIIQQGADYIFDLRKDVYWHDSTVQTPRPFGIQDVLSTLNLISQIETPEGLDISYVQAVKQMAWERVGENSIRICTTNEQLQASIPDDLKSKPCSAVDAEKPILANFLELISFKIMPAHHLVGVDSQNIYSSDPPINKRPIGTGSFKFGAVTDNSISLIRNDNYYGNIPKLDRVEFRLFRDRSSAVHALENSEIHALATTATDAVRSMASYGTVQAHTSPVLVNQYWGIYFNLRKDLDGKAVGKESLQDVNVRRAISAAIDRERLIQAMYGIGEEAIGPIHKDSQYYSKNAEINRYNIVRANSLLSKAGWTLDTNLGYRKKNNQLLSFKLSFANTPDRVRIVESIKQDLEKVGIELVPDPWDLQSLFAQVVSPKLFDSLLYGMNTFIDPDRYELFHSDESLNLASYEGSEDTAVIENKKTIRVPRVDRLLDRARSFDPVLGRKKRKEDYQDVQKLIAEDSPVVFLYHPQFIYFVNSRVKNVDLSGALILEKRFINIHKWVILE